MKYLIGHPQLIRFIERLFLKNRAVIIIALFTCVFCKDNMRSSAELSNLDKLLSETLEIEDGLLEEYLEQEPKSEYLNGMYLYFNSNEGNATDFLSELQGKRAGLGLDGPSMRLANGHMGILGRKIEGQEVIIDAIKLYGSNHWLLLELSEWADSTSTKILLLDSALSMKPDFYRAKVAKAYILEVTTEFEFIIKLIESKSELPANSDLHNFLAEAYFFKGDLETSENLYRRSIEIRPNVRGYTGLGNTYHHQLGDLKTAKYYYSLAMDLDSANVSIIRSMGWLNHDVGDDVNALYFFDKLLERTAELDEIELSDLLDFYIISRKSKQSKALVDTMRNRFGDNYRTMGYYLIVYHSGAQWNVNELHLDAFEKKFGNASIEWLNEKLELLGLSRGKVQSMESLRS